MYTFRWLKVHQGTAYYNTRADQLIARYMLPPSLREPLLERLHPSQLDKALSAPFDLERCISMLLGIEETNPSMGIVNDFLGAGGLAGTEGIDVFAARRGALEATVFPSEEELRDISDEELKERIKVANQVFDGAGLGTWGKIFIYVPTIRAILQGLLLYWYDGDNPHPYMELISGLPGRTLQSQDDYDFWKLAETIRESQTLSALIKDFEGAAFFEELKNHQEGRAFLSRYEDFMEVNFLSGHADRDMYFPRRIEDPTIDYKALRQLATTDMAWCHRGNGRKSAPPSRCTNKRYLTIFRFLSSRTFSKLPM